MSGVHQRAAAGVSLSSEAEVPQRPHKGVRQSAKTGELYLAHSVHKYTSVDFLMLQCQNHKEVWQCAETGEVLALYSAHFFWHCHSLMLAVCEFLLISDKTFSKHVLPWLSDVCFYTTCFGSRLPGKTRHNILYIIWDISENMFGSRLPVKTARH